MNDTPNRFKFRVFDKEMKRMHTCGEDSHDSITFFGTVACYYNLQNGCGSLPDGSGTYELMQSTGLKDKNGKEIYESDIVEITGPYTIHSAKHFQYSREMYSNGERFVVIWNDAGYEVRCLRDWVVNKKKNFAPNGYNYKPYVDFYDFWNLQRNFTVIGNTYDNPELLEDFHD